jgi:hypothetical protein
MMPPPSSFRRIDKPSPQFICVNLGEGDYRYVIDAKPVFEDLRQIVSQLAGLMLVDRTGGASTVAGCTLLGRTNDLFGAVREVIGTLRPDERSRHHFSHLQSAAKAIATLLGAMDRARLDADVERRLPMLKTAWQELTHAANALPGFETVDFSRSCCASHMTLRNASIVCEGAPL